MDFLTSTSTIALSDIPLRLTAAGFIGIATGFSYQRTFRGRTYSTSSRNTRSQTTEATYRVKLAEDGVSSAETQLPGGDAGVVSTQLIEFDGVNEL